MRGAALGVRLRVRVLLVVPRVRRGHGHVVVRVVHVPVKRAVARPGVAEGPGPAEGQEVGVGVVMAAAAADMAKTGSMFCCGTLGWSHMLIRNSTSGSRTCARERGAYYGYKLDNIH